MRRRFNFHVEHKVWALDSAMIVLAFFRATHRIRRE
jgi:hypothetical protein